MGKKYREKTFGRALIKDCFTRNKYSIINDDHLICSLNMQGGFNSSVLNLQSITEESSHNKFYSTIELLGSEFQAQKFNVKLIDTKKKMNSLFKEKCTSINLLGNRNEFLTIARRPKWDNKMTIQEFKIYEKKEFLEWKKKLSALEELHSYVITPYETNIERWRELWRVIEHSDVIVQIVDARNPLLFRCTDLEQYVKEVNPNKVNIILINKADFLTLDQRKIWANYFSIVGVKIVFFSATSAVKNNGIECSQYAEYSSEEKNNTKLIYNFNTDELPTFEKLKNNLNNTVTKIIPNLDINKNLCNKKNDEALTLLKISNKSKILNRDDLIAFFKTVSTKSNFTNPVTIGFVGYPNVGKSSIINVLFNKKKVPVSATPGKSKHVQSLNLDNELILCDCPGIVLPSFVRTKAEMILNGILPISHIQDYIPSVNLLGTLIPRQHIEELYGIMIPLTSEQDITHSPMAEEILNAHGYNRGFMTQNGQPDNARSAQHILKDFVNGKLLYCSAPPNYNQNEFYSFTLEKKKVNSSSIVLENTKSKKYIQSTIAELDTTFFKKNTINVHIKGRHMQVNSSHTTAVQLLPNECYTSKTWKKNKNSINKKHEKSRRIYAHLDQH